MIKNLTGGKSDIFVFGSIFSIYLSFYLLTG